MKNLVKTFVAMSFCLAVVPVYAQMGGGMGQPRGPRLDGSMAKLFGKNSAYTATLEMTTKTPKSITMLGKLAFDAGKSRFEMDMGEAKGGAMPPEAATQMKAMGMDKMIIIGRPDKKIAYMVYPGLNAYAETSSQDQDAGKIESDYKLEVTKQGEETVDGHPCVKNKAVVTDNNGGKHESMIWNATDLKEFPVKIETTENGNTMTMLFKNVKLSKPSASQFEPPTGMKRYDNPMALMQEEMMKRMGGAMGMPRAR